MEKDDIFIVSSHLTELEEIFVELARTKDPVAEAEKNRIIFRSFPKSFFIEVAV